MYLYNQSEMKECDVQSYVKLGRDVQLMTSSFQLAGCGRQRALCGLETVEPAGVLH